MESGGESPKKTDTMFPWNEGGGLRGSEIKETSECENKIVSDEKQNKQKKKEASKEKISSPKKKRK